MNTPIIYNLFPRLIGDMRRWPAHASRAREMGFNWLFLNPIQYPGFSGSLYAVKDHFRLNPLFIPPDSKDPMATLAATIDVIHHAGLSVMMDLVINHTSKDSELIKSHPEWYKRDEKGKVLSPSAIDPADARNVTVWGDLAEIDNEASSDRHGLWEYWLQVVRYYLDLGFDGFRCDAAYKVPRPLWEYLIDGARKKKPNTLFTAETLGCRISEVEELRGSGFDFLFNSSKWWKFDATWCLEQHEAFQKIAPSIAFPESHDTPRLMQETGGVIAAQKQSYAFTAIFSAGILVPLGFEFGFQKKLDVVSSTPEHWEETGLDLSSFILTVNRLKTALPVLGHEGHWEPLSPLGGMSVILKKSMQKLSSVVVVVNKDWHKPLTVELPFLDEWATRKAKVYRPFVNSKGSAFPTEKRLELEPAEVVYIG